MHKLATTHNKNDPFSGEYDELLSKLNYEYVNGLSPRQAVSFLNELASVRAKLGHRSSCSVRKGSVVISVDVDRAVLLGKIIMAENDLKKKVYK
jgi:hypothetical protein